MTVPKRTDVEGGIDSGDSARFCDGADDMIDRAFAEARLPLAFECVQHPEIDAGDK